MCTVPDRRHFQDEGSPSPSTHPPPTHTIILNPSIYAQIRPRHENDKPATACTHPQESRPSSYKGTIPHWWIAVVIPGPMGDKMLHIDVNGPAYGAGEATAKYQGRSAPFHMFATPGGPPARPSSSPAFYFRQAEVQIRACAVVCVLHIVHAPLCSHAHIHRTSDRKKPHNTVGSLSPPFCTCGADVNPLHLVAFFGCPARTSTLSPKYRATVSSRLGLPSSRRSRQGQGPLPGQRFRHDILPPRFYAALPRLHDWWHHQSHADHHVSQQDCRRSCGRPPHCDCR